MKFTINKNILDETLEIVSRYSDPINSLYGFRCIMIKVKNDVISFEASDGVISIVKNLDVDDVNIKVEEEGQFLIQTNIFKNVIKKLNCEILLSQNTNASLEIRQGLTKYSLTTNPINTFPPIEEAFNTKEVEIDTKQFRNAVKNVAFAASTENSLIYKCINMKFKNNSLRFTATDTYRLAYYTIKVPYKGEEFGISVNSKNVKELIPQDAPTKVSLFYNEIKMGIKYKNTVITTRIVDMPYQDAESLFASLNPRYKITITKEEITDLINKVWIGSSEKQNRLEISITNKEITILNRLDEIGTSIAKSNKFQLEGKPVEFDVNYNFLKDALSVFDGEIYLIMDDPIRKILIISKSNEDTKQLITPLKR